tara:strand:+ start:1103 stop:1324 length:222 start_codon:yes stop_codon:yes gene_type:complete
MDVNKFKEWFNKQDNENLDKVYDLLENEYKSRGLNIKKDRGFYRSSKNDSEDIKASLSERFNYDDDSGYGQWC